ncbi:P-loop containing nucleoside triphosphate hydrolase protein, partial [Dimargaris cristalligena]
LEQAHRDLRTILTLPLQYPQHFATLNVECPKGVLLHGPPGVGKTWLVSTVARECQALLHNISDEIDALTPHRNDSGQHESRVIAQLLTLMDGLVTRGRLVVIAATNRPNAIDTALRRPGRFDREVSIDVPTETARAAILRYHTRKLPLAPDLDLDYLAAMTTGYVGADLAALCREAARSVIYRQFEATRSTQPEADLPDSGAPLPLTLTDFQKALKSVGPSLQRGLNVEVPPLTWADIGGLDQVKRQLQQAVEWPLLYPDTFRRLGLSTPAGILLYGPPGCSKTTLVKVIASQTRSSFFAINGAALYSSYVGDSERILRDLFRRARASSPAVIFLDEIDTIVGKRHMEAGGSGGGGGADNVQERILTMLLTEMDGVESNHASVLLVGATNRPDMLDAALLRPGRFDRLIYVPPPDPPARRQILDIATRNTPLHSGLDLGTIVERTEGFSGADLMNLCREAALISLRHRHEPLPVEMVHFEEALSQVHPSIPPSSLRQYAVFQQSRVQ